jgi:hypothetical protein
MKSKYEKILYSLAVKLKSKITKMPISLGLAKYIAAYTYSRISSEWVGHCSHLERFSMTWVLVICLVGFLWGWGLNPGPHTC